MIKTKTALLIFVVLCILIFPYNISILFIDSNFLNSLVPGWHTTIIPGQLISNLVKFLILLAITLFYWKLTKVTNELNSKKFLLHFLLTIPTVFIGRLSVYEMLHYYSVANENLMLKITIVIFANTFINILFFLGQILFVIHYRRVRKTLNTYYDKHNQDTQAI